MKRIVLILTCCFSLQGFSQKSDEIIHIHDDIELLKITDDIYMHKSYKVSEKWGRISANGLIYKNKKRAFIFDTPWNNEQTEILIAWLEDSLNLNVIGLNMKSGTTIDLLIES